jgi:hypothetical protein
MELMNGCYQPGQRVTVDMAKADDRWFIVIMVEGQ